MTNEECMKDLERLSEIKRLREQQEQFKNQYIILKMQEDISDTGEAFGSLEVAQKYVEIQAQIETIEMKTINL